MRAAFSTAVNTEKILLCVFCLHVINPHIHNRWWTIFIAFYWLFLCFVINTYCFFFYHLLFSVFLFLFYLIICSLFFFFFWWSFLQMCRCRLFLLIGDHMMSDFALMKVSCRNVTADFRISTREVILLLF